MKKKNRKKFSFIVEKVYLLLKDRDGMFSQDICFELQEQFKIQITPHFLGWVLSWNKNYPIIKDKTISLRYLHPFYRKK